MNTLCITFDQGESQYDLFKRQTSPVVVI